MFDAPEQVQPKPFELRVGLAQSATKGTEVGLDVPDSPFTLTVELILNGFTLLNGATTTRVTEVSPEDPYPYEVLRVVAGEDLPHDRRLTILAMYYVEGRLIGIASRQIIVSTKDIPVDGGADTEAVAWVLDGAAERPDVEILVLPGNDGRSMVWHYRSPHPEVGDSGGPLSTPISDSTATTMRRFTQGIERRANLADLQEYTNGVAARIGRTVHTKVWQALARAGKHVGGPPTVLLATWDPHVPWELARVPEVWL
ncbi:hypothetical protein ACFQ1S_34360, partial [Kibdelosporangium lantanae]